ncbi:hypothetical protein ACFL1U_02205 [Patescibacteria group bacterium]
MQIVLLIPLAAIAIISISGFCFAALISPNVRGVLDRKLEALERNHMEWLAYGIFLVILAHGIMLMFLYVIAIYSLLVCFIAYEKVTTFKNSTSY